jgi:hypothetical protein
MIAGRVEGMITVPTGATVSATIPNGAGAQVATVPAGSYFLTSAGAVSSFVSALQSSLNQATLPAPTTAAAVAAAIGYGTWTTGAGYLLQEASGNLAASFGSPTLTATSLTYQNAGHTTGDYAIGFSAAGSKADGGDVYDVTGAQDLIVAWVGNMSGIPAALGGVISKWTISAGNGGWTIQASSVDGGLDFQAANTTPAVDFQTTRVIPTFGAWHVGIAVIDRSTGKARIGVRSLAGVASISAEVTAAAVSYANAAALRLGQRADGGVDACSTMKLSSVYVVSGAGVATGLSANLATALTNFANAINAAWTVSLDTSGGTGRMSIGWSGYSTPTWSLAWSNTTMRDLAGFAADITAVTTTQIGTKQARGLWFPNCPLFVSESDPHMAPVQSDARSTVSPTGKALTLVGNYFRMHRNVRWSHVSIDRMREQSATYANASWRQFWDDTQLGRGLSWFSPGSALLIVDENGNVLGSDFSVAGTGPTSGWQLVDPGDVQPKRVDAGGNTLYWTIELPELVAQDT